MTATNQPDSQAGDERRKTIVAILRNQQTTGLAEPETVYALEAYAERLATKRAIEARIDELDGLFPEDSRTGEGYYSVPAKWLDEHYTALSASLTKEDKS